MIPAVKTDITAFVILLAQLAGLLFHCRNVGAIFAAIKLLCRRKVAPDATVKPISDLAGTPGADADDAVGARYDIDAKSLVVNAS